MTKEQIEQALEKYEEELNELPDDELIGEERLRSLREDEIEAQLDAYRDYLGEMPDDELLDLERISEEIIAELVDKRAEELESQGQ
jgi:hypothetical protein